MTPPSPNPTKHNAALDGLRGLAALGVCIFHMRSCGFGPLGHEWVLAGQLGVNLFFCLSGFLIARSVLAPAAWNFPRYFESRARRILPNFYIAILLVLTLVDNKVAYSTSGWKFLANLASHLTLLHGWFADFRVSIMGPFWTLSHEWCFYLLMGLAAPFLRGARGWTIPAALLAVGLLSRWGIYHGHWSLPSGYSHPLCMWDQFALGIFAAFAARSGAGKLRAWHLWVLGTAGCILIAAMLHRYVSASVSLSDLDISQHGRAFSKAFWKRSSNALYFSTLLATGFSLVILSLWLIPAPKIAWLHRTPLPWMGKVSYSTYLYHVPVVLCFMFSFRALEPGSLLENPHVAFLIILATVYGFSEFAYRTFEKPWLTPSRPLPCRKGASN